MDFTGIFALFPSGKKCGGGSALGVGTECGLYSVHAGCLCGLYWAVDVGRRCWAHLVAVGVWQVVLGQGPFYLVGRSWVTWRRRLGGGACGAVLGLGGRRPCCAGRPAGGGSGPCVQLFDQRDVLGGVLVAEAWAAAGAFSPGVVAHHTGDKPM